MNRYSILYSNFWHYETLYRADNAEKGESSDSLYPVVTLFAQSEAGDQ